MGTHNFLLTDQDVDPVADALFGGRGSDILVGTDGDDILKGGIGRDIVDGLNGNDYVRGGPGDDQIGGQRGSDILRGGKGDDVVFVFEVDDVRGGPERNDLCLLSGDLEPSVLKGCESINLAANVVTAPIRGPLQ